MINTFLNLTRFKTDGAVTLVMSIILLVACTLIIIFAANQGQVLEKITANQNRNAQAFEAAEAGLEYGINYLDQNYATILASPSGGYIQAYSDSNTSKTLANGSSYVITYSNPIANNYNIIKITSTGKSDDNSSTRVVSQEISYGTLLTNPGTRSLTAKGSVSMSGSSNILNTTTNQTIQAGGSVTLSGASSTTTSGGGSSAGNIRSDIQQNSSTLSSLSNNDFFAQFFGTNNMNVVQSQMANVYTNTTNTNYSSTLAGKTGTTIWINQSSNTTATINGSTTIGSTTNPVLIVVNGNLSLSGNVTIYGFVYVLGATGIDTLTGNTTINGGLAISDNLNMTGSINLNFNSTVISNLQNNNSLRYYAKIPGTWKDF